MSKKNLIVACIGFRGSGKSTVAANILRKQHGVLVYDANQDEAYDWINGRGRTVASVQAMEDYLDVLQDQPAWIEKKQFAVRYVPDLIEDTKEDLDEFCRVAWQCENIWLGVEEIQEAVGSASAAAMPPQLRRIVGRGRHRGLNQVYCGLRYAEIPRPITAGADIQVIFQQTEPSDLDGIEERLSPIFGPDFAERGIGEIAQLPPYTAIVFTRDRRWFRIGSREEWFPQRLAAEQQKELDTVSYEA